jgi:general secretion pathway protein J
MIMRSPSAAKGFTLFELLVAMTIFAIISYMAYSGLRNILDARSQTDLASDRLAELQMAFLRMGNDLQQAVPRPIRGEYGDDRKALIGAELGDMRLEFTRTGRRNPARTPRSVLQRVAYTLSDQVLYRITWTALDRPQDAQPQRSALLTQVEKLEIRYLDNNYQWHTSWPPEQNAAALLLFPRAVEIKVETSDMGSLNRYFILSEV